MSEDDRIRWDERYRSGDGPVALAGWAPDWLAEIDGWLPTRGPALDIAAGSGRVSRWLARRGLDVTAVDVSPVGLAQAREAVESDGLRLTTVAADLENQPLPDGPFQLVTCFHYRQRSLFPAIWDCLAPGGVLVAEIATVANLERHEHPSRRFLAEPGELEQDIRPLEVLYYREGWFDGRALARVVARKQPLTGGDGVMQRESN